MTQFSRKALKIKHKHRPGDGADANGRPGPMTTAAPRRLLPPWAVALLCVAVTAAASFALFEYLILSKVPRPMLGKWVVTQGDMVGATLEFYRDGTMIGRLTKDGKEGVIKARVRADDATLWSTTTNPMTHREETATQAIVSLTEDELILEDDKGGVIKMERVR
jgi:uncharacterized protein (TIGR03066 family)